MLGEAAFSSFERMKQRFEPEVDMPRYVVERTFDGALPIPEGHEAAEACRQIVGRNTDQGVTWVHSTSARRRTSSSASTTRPARRRSGKRPR